MLSRKNLKSSAVRYLASLIVYSLAMVLYTNHNYYKGLLSSNTLTTLRILYAIYVIWGFPYLVVGSKKEVHKPLELIRAVRDLIKAFWSFSYSFIPGKKRLVFKLDSEYKKTILFALVKVFYIPLMFNFLFGNWMSVKGYLTRWQATGFSFSFRKDYLFIISLIFLLDTLVFCFGYLVEHKRLKNVVKSVEPTIIGWAVALAAYPPFNTVTGQVLSWYSSDHFYYGNAVIDVVAKIAVLALLFLYLWASFSLGPKASNLTNRGIVFKGAYKWVRHPAYIGKVSAWWIMALPHFSIGALFSLLGWSLVYYLRAITEERHLIKDKDYKDYVKKVKYRFIPKVI